MLCLCLIAWASPAAHAQEEFLEPEEAFVLAAAMTTPTELLVQFSVAPAYYMYRTQFHFAVSEPGAWLGQPVFPAGKVKYDPTFDQNMEVYYDTVRIALPLHPGATQPLQLTITSQGCADAGLCYVPMDSTLQLIPTASGYDVAGAGVGSLARLDALQAHRAPETSAVSVASLLSSADTGLAAYLAQAGLWHIVLVCLLLGMLLAFTPCVLPMVPILLTLIAGDTAHAASRGRKLRLSSLYVLGMSIVYTVMGVAAGLLGASLAVWLQTPWVLGVFAALLVVLALSMFDLIQVQAPRALQTALHARLGRIPGGRAGGALLMGMLSALIVGPCVAAPLAGVLLFISGTGDVLTGGLALFSLAWGQGLLLLVVGASSGALLPRAGVWMEHIKHGFGLLLLATAWWMLMPVLPAVVLMLGWALLAIWAALLLGALRPLPRHAGAARLFFCALGYGLILWGTLLLVGLAAGGRDALRPLHVLTRSGTGATTNGLPETTLPTFTRIQSRTELAQTLAHTQQPVLLDFYADWCVACREMEQFTFSDAQVARQMAGLILLQVDVTGNTAEDRALLKQFRLFGPPGMVFFDAQGALLPTARVIGFQDARRFSAVLDGVLNKR